jgi:hypothetical protein
MGSTGISLVPRRSGELAGGGEDYAIYAGEQLVGRIYRGTLAKQRESWFWGLNTVFTDGRQGPMYGQAETRDAARQRLRERFETWLAWALAVPETHPSFGTIDAQVRRIGARV